MSDAIEAWAPDCLKEELEKNMDSKYIRYNGLKSSQKNKGHKYHSFDFL